MSLIDLRNTSAQDLELVKTIFPDIVSQLTAFKEQQVEKVATLDSDIELLEAEIQAIKDRIRELEKQKKAVEDDYLTPDSGYPEIIDIITIVSQLRDSLLALRDTSDGSDILWQTRSVILAIKFLLADDYKDLGELYLTFHYATNTNLKLAIDQMLQDNGLVISELQQKAIALYPKAAAELGWIES